jgi:branched-chain amino acid transport system substrate-binding protein
VPAVLQRSTLALAVAALAAPFALAACGGGGGGSSNDQLGDVQGIQADCGNLEYHGSGTPSKLIVSDLPLKGDSAERSKQQNDAIVQELSRKGWQAGQTQVAFQACDDSIASTGEWDEGLCRSNAQKYAANPDVIGVIGTYNSGCAAIEMPVLNKAQGGPVPMVSPGNTFVCLTEPSPTLCKPDEPGVYFPSGKRNYIRVVPNDAVQGAGMASFANGQGIRKPFILIASDDPTSEGQGRTFEGAAKSLGMSVAGVEHYDPEASSYTGLMKKAKAAGADAVFLGAILEENGAQLIKDKVSVLGPNDGVKLLAPDGFGQQSTIDQAGSASAGMYVSLPGKVPGSLTGEGSAFVKELKAQVGDEPIEVFAPYAGEAAEVLINAIKVGGTRSGTVDTLLKTHVTDGITGTFSITPSGDPSPAPISVQQAGDTFALVKTIVPQPELVSAARGG